MIQDKNHLEMVRSLPCLICGGRSVAHHVRNGWNGGMGVKPESIFTLPLCVACHSDLHQVGEDVFWRSHHINQYEEIIKIILRKDNSLPF